MTGKYRAAVVGGAGMWGNKYLKAFAEHPDCEVILVDSARERRQPFVDHFGIQTVYDTVEEMLAAEVPDIVSAILPVDQAPAAVIACAQAGVKAVSCEKPIAVELSVADEMVRVCRESGTAFGCATAYWEMPFLPELSQWIADGNIGRIVSAAIPGGLPVEVAGAGCVQLTMLRLLTRMEVDWIEGWVNEPEDGYRAPEASDLETDCPAFGRLGLSNASSARAPVETPVETPGGIECEILEPRSELRTPCRVSVTCENGRVWLTQPEPVIIQGTGSKAAPVRPDFLDEERPRRSMRPAVERLVRAVEIGAVDVPCSGHDYRQALEIAIGIKLSAHSDHERVNLPLASRSHRIYPHPYRMRGGDVVGWESIGYEGPPEVEHRVRRRHG